ncbi:MAG: hypothetical protein H6626_01600 [Pseudobdellovibrionaceae bacterium]|nr:hypothetical protein [Bdellovibrionales bacterium]USN47813.1 MAG: hypothetical protein H6626_01600 [Pseudobdellovibrionaceae bacterium]
MRFSEKPHWTLPIRGFQQLKELSEKTFGALPKSPDNKDIGKMSKSLSLIFNRQPIIKNFHSKPGPIAS